MPDGIVGPPPPPGGPLRRRRPVLAAVRAALVVAVLAAVTAGLVVRIPYYAIAPGSARETETLIEGPEGATYPSEGEVLFVTVSQRRVTPFGAITGWLDPGTDVRPQEDIIGPQTPSESRELNLRLMDASKDLALYVALEHLGYDVAVEGGGAAVIEVVPGVPAADVLEVGDVITAVDGVRVEFADQLRTVLADYEAGEQVQLTLRRDGDVGHEQQLSVTLGRREDGSALLGVRAGDPATTTFVYPVDVGISSGPLGGPRVGGPSAGLAFTLAVLDALTPGELTGGAAVAATGTIGHDATVGRVGGMRQKTLAVRRAGADVFLVPSADFDGAAEAAGEDLRVVAVDDLDDALRALSDLGGNALALDAPTSARPPS